jgi:RND family efflux transporter MFP subunit
MKDIVKIFSLTAILMLTPPAVFAADGHGHGAEEGEDAETGVEITASQATLAGIKVGLLEARPMLYQVYAPGEVLANGYTSYLVSSRVDSVVLQRHTSLGAHVQVGQPLVTLFSDTVAEAQATFRVADAEYKRVKKLGRKTVGDKRFIQSQNDYEVSRGRLLAFGLSEEAIKATSAGKKQIGKYTLEANVDGVVLSDDFRQGQRVEAGDPLMELACERELWIEARLAPNAKVVVTAGTVADVKIAGERFQAEVIQEAHTIDEITRTRVVRLLVNNEAHKLHPGQYADVYFNFTTDEQVLAVPETALMRGGDGDWVVFVEEEPGHYIPHEVELGRSLGGFREISGVPDGSTIVMEGAFFVASEIAKSGFDPHDH